MNAVAKINLFLQVLNQRPDGYHNLKNVFLPVPSLYDEVHFEAAENGGLSLESSGDFPVPCDSSNLCLKAADAFMKASGRRISGKFHLEKHIPVAAGLGGGSSDAAAVLRLLNDYCGNPLSADILHGIASSLGADVPFFLNPVLSLGTGLGTILEPLPPAHLPGLVIAAPLFPLPVAWSFIHRLPAPADAPALEAFLAAMASGNRSDIARSCRNDLEHAVYHKFPILRRMRDAMLKAGADTVHISGSGPTLFALASNDRLETIAQAAQTVYAGKTIISPAC